MRAWLAGGLMFWALGAHAASDAGQQAFDSGRAYRQGTGVARDPARAFVLIEQAARAGHSAAMFTLFNMLMKGEGAAPDPVAARRWLEAAAERDNPQALQQLALLLQDGAMGYARDEKRAAQLLRELAHALKHPAHH